MNTRHLQFVVVAAEHESFTRAAQVLHVAPPSLSQAIAGIERQVGATLFERTSRRVALTPAGEAFVAAARRVLRDIEDLRTVVASADEAIAGRLDLAVQGLSTADVLAELLATYRHRHPGVSVRVDAPEAALVARAVATGRSELAISTERAPETLVSEPFHQQRYLLVAPPGTELPDGPVRFRDLAELPLIVPIGGELLSPSEAGGRRREPRPYAIETADRESIVPLVLAGVGMSFLPAGLAEHAARLGATVATTTPSITRTLHVIRRPGPPSAVAAAFLAVAREHAQPVAVTTAG